MSYKATKTKNPLHNLFRRLFDFYRVAPNLLNSKSLEEFELWLDKLMQIDRRSLYRYLKAHKANLPKEYLNAAQYYYIRSI